MKTLLASIPQQLQSDLDKIRSQLSEFVACYQRLYDESAFAPVTWADQALTHLETWLLDEEQKQLLKLNPWEIFLLHATAYLCDIGLADTPNTRCPVEIIGNSDARGPINVKSIYARSADLIKSNWQELGVRDAHIAALIADICTNMGHDAKDPNRAQTAKTEPVIDGIDINDMLVSAAIELAHELNLKRSLTAARISRLFPQSANLSNDQYRNAFSVTHSGPHPYVAGTIQLKIVCNEPEIHRALKHHERMVRERMDAINSQIYPRFLFSDIIYEIEANGYTPLDLKFSVDTSAALQLLTGNRLYSDNRVFLRELIQNAVDACNLRKRFDNTYTPSISIRFNDDISRVTVRDNGIGMDRQWIEKYFLTIGISLYQSPEVRSVGQRSRIDFSFISQFGIGFLSSFLVAEKIIIKTCKTQGTGLMITITDLRDYFDVRSIKDDVTPGTEVTLQLRPSKMNYCRSLEFAGYLKTNIRFLDIPVQLHDQDGQVTTIGRESLSYENSKSADIDFIAPLDFKDSEGYLLLRAKKNVDHIFTVESAKGGVSVFQDGIFITQLDTLLPEGARHHVVGRINLKGEEKCALSMDRNRIFWTRQQLQAIKKTIRIGLAAVTGKFMSAVDAQDVAHNTKRSIINILSVFFEFNEVDDTIHGLLSLPIRQVVEKRFRDFVRIHFVHTHRPEGIPEADGYNHHWQQHIIESFRKN